MNTRAEKIRLRDRILEAALPHVAFDGWTRRALVAGARDAELDAADALRAFPQGGRQAVEHFSDIGDRRMAETLATADLAQLPARTRIAQAVRARLEAVGPHREAARRALGLLALPFNAPLAAELTARTVDAMWRAVGDRSADFSYYTKRATLAAIYAATVLCWLADDSEGSTATWAFLERRLDDVQSLRRLAPGAILDRFGFGGGHPRRRAPMGS